MLRQIKKHSYCGRGIKHLHGICRWSLMPLLMLFATGDAIASSWRTLAPGVEYQDLIRNPITPWSHIHAFRIDLKNYQLDLVSATDFKEKQAGIDEFARKSQAIIAINGGFFDGQYHPLGLRIDQHRQHHPIKRVSWWGVLFIKNQTAYIVSSKDYQSDKSIQFAVQAGPRLIIDGHIPHLKPGIAERSALGITRQNHLILLVTNNTMITTTELARLMKAPPLSCTSALNLDGGSSSQLFAHIQSFRLNVHGFSNVADAIVVKPSK
jgi:uncharacterized protein YigE (DUF2233 family)